MLVTKSPHRSPAKRTLATGDIDGIGVQGGTVSWAANGTVRRLRFDGGATCLVARADDAHVWDSNNENTAVHGERQPLRQ